MYCDHLIWLLWQWMALWHTNRHWCWSCVWTYTLCASQLKILRVLCCIFFFTISVFFPQGEACCSHLFLLDYFVHDGFFLTDVPSLDEALIQSSKLLNVVFSALSCSINFSFWIISYFSCFLTADLFFFFHSLEFQWLYLFGFMCWCAAFNRYWAFIDHYDQKVDREPGPG